MNKKLKEYKIYKFSMVMKKSDFIFNIFSKITREVTMPFTINLSEKDCNEFNSILSMFYNDVIKYITQQKDNKIYLWQIYIFHKESGRFEFIIISLSSFEPETFNKKSLLRTDEIVYQIVVDSQDSSTQKISQALVKNISLLSRFFEKQFIDIAIKN